MKKFLLISIIGLAFCAFAPNNSFAGNPLKDLANIGKAPTATKTGKTTKTVAGNRGPSNKALLEKFEALEAAFKKLQEVEKPDNIHTGNLNKHLVPFWVVLGLGVLLGLLGVVLTIKSLVLGSTVRSNKGNIAALTNRVARVAPPDQQQAPPDQQAAAGGN